MDPTESIKDMLSSICENMHVKNIDVQNGEHFNVVFQCKMVKGKDCDEKCNYWIQEFSKSTNTNWITKKRFARATRYIFRKVFACHHSKINKSVKRKRQDCRDRNRKCEAYIDIKFKKINRDTIKNDALLKDGLNVIIKIVFTHSHKIHVAEAYSYLRPNSEITQTFNSYFLLGMTPACAKTHHEITLLESNENESVDTMQLLANAQVNPTERQIKYLYEKWRATEYVGPKTRSVPEMLRLKQTDLELKGCELVIRENPLIVIIVTPIMKRTFAEDFSNETVFIDSNGTCQANMYVTFLFAATKVGALPLACIVHTGQNESNYTLCFSAVKDTLELAGKLFSPNIIITDDSAAERSALKAVFPASNLLLCTFELCEALWRRVWQPAYKVAKHNRSPVVQMFRDVLSSATPEDAEKYFRYLKSSNKVRESKRLRDYLNRLWERRAEWCVCYRNDTTAGRNDTNKSSEASIRILKDVILQDCKAFDCCALVDFVVSKFEAYYKKTLLEFTTCGVQPRIDYKDFYKKVNNIKNIYKVNEQFYHIASEQNNSLVYTVNIANGFCDCPRGTGGAFCTHLCAVHLQCGFLFPNSLTLHHEERLQLAQIAVGVDVPPDLYGKMDFEDTKSNIDVAEMEISEPALVLCKQENSTEVKGFGYNIEQHGEAVEDVRAELQRIGELFSETKTPDETAILIKFNEILKKIQTPVQALTFATNNFI